VQEFSVTSNSSLNDDFFSALTKSRLKSETMHNEFFEHVTHPRNPIVSSQSSQSSAFSENDVSETENDDDKAAIATDNVNAGRSSVEKVTCTVESCKMHVRPQDMDYHLRIKYYKCPHCPDAFHGPEGFVSHSEKHSLYYNIDLLRCECWDHLRATE
jgi:hypothetical protein